MANPPDIVTTLLENHGVFLGFLERRLHNRALAEDILQDAFVRSIDKVGTIRDEEAAVAWFYRMLRNAVIDHQRRGATAERALRDLAEELENETAGADSHQVVCRCVAALAGTLKPEYAEAIRRVELDGVAVKDYAAEAGISGNNAGVRVFRARDALRRQVEKICGACATHGCLDCTCGGRA